MTKMFELFEKINRDANYLIFRVFPYLTLLIIFLISACDFCNYHINDYIGESILIIGVYHNYSKFGNYVYPNIVYNLYPLLAFIPTEYETRVDPKFIILKIIMTCIDIECFLFGGKPAIYAESYISDISKLIRLLMFLNHIYFRLAIKIIELISLYIMNRTIGRVARPPIRTSKKRVFLDTTEIY